MLQLYPISLSNNTLNQLVACGDALLGVMQSQEKIQDLVKSLNFCASSMYFSLFDPKMNSLHTAARQGNVKILNNLLSSGSDINVLDQDGLSPLLTAAIHGRTYAVKTLLDKGANPRVLSKFEGSFADYLRMTSGVMQFKETIQDLSSLNMSYSTHTSDKLDVSSQCLNPGVVLTSENVAKPEVLDRLIRSDITPESEHVNILKHMLPEGYLSYFLEKYEEFKKNPPALAISQVFKDDNNKPLPAKMCGLIAKQKIAKGSIIGEYTGEIKPDYYPYSWFQNDDTYLLSTHPVIDSIQYRSSASMSNHGFPNAQLVSLAKGKYLKGLDGLPFRHVLIAMEDISEGEEIVWNYGPDYLGGSHLVEIRPKALEHFLKTVSWEKLIKALKQYSNRKNSPEMLLQLFDSVYKFKYLTDCPSSVEFAIKNKYLKADDLEQFYHALINPSFPFLGKTLIQNFLGAAIDIFRRDAEL